MSLETEILKASPAELLAALSLRLATIQAAPVSLAPPVESERKGLLTLTEAAALLGLDRTVKHPEKAVLYMCKTGKLIPIHIGKSVMIDPKSIDDLVGRKIT